MLKHKHKHTKSNTTMEKETEIYDITNIPFDEVQNQKSPPQKFEILSEDESSPISPVKSKRESTDNEDEKVVESLTLKNDHVALIDDLNYYPSKTLPNMRVNPVRGKEKEDSVLEENLDHSEEISSDPVENSLEIQLKNKILPTTESTCVIQDLKSPDIYDFTGENVQETLVENNLGFKNMTLLPGQGTSAENAQVKHDSPPESSPDNFTITCIIIFLTYIIIIWIAIMFLNFVNTFPVYLIPPVFAFLGIFLFVGVRKGNLVIVNVSMVLLILSVVGLICLVVFEVGRLGRDTESKSRLNTFTNHLDYYKEYQKIHKFCQQKTTHQQHQQKYPNIYKKCVQNTCYHKNLNCRKYPYNFNSINNEELYSINKVHNQGLEIYKNLQMRDMKETFEVIVVVITVIVVFVLMAVVFVRISWPRGGSEGRGRFFENQRGVSRRDGHGYFRSGGYY